MSVLKDKKLSEALRSYIVEHADLPVKGGAFSIDALLPEGRSMSLMFTTGRVTSTYIDGTKNYLQYFTIFYRGNVTDDNDIKSSMMESLNSIGKWMGNEDKPYLGDWLKVKKLEQVSLANIISQDEKSITYQAGYALAYEA